MTHLLLDALLQGLPLIMDLAASLLNVTLGIADLLELVQKLLPPFVGRPAPTAREFVPDGALDWQTYVR